MKTPILFIFLLLVSAVSAQKLHLYGGSIVVKLIAILYGMTWVSTGRLIVRCLYGMILVPMATL